MKGSYFGLGTWLAMTGLVPFTGACAYPGDPGEQVELGKTGRVRLSLLAETDGTVYQLRNALFDVVGPTGITLDSEVDPDAIELSATLPTGSYDITLRDGWALERLQGTGSVIVEAELASSNPQVFHILANTATSLYFRFITHGEVVELGTGDLSVIFDVDERSGSACDVLSQAGCPAFEGCYPAGESGMCSHAGSIPVGGICEVSQACEPGAICASVGMGFSCSAVCGLDGGPPACSYGSCSGSGVPGVGICT